MTAPLPLTAVERIDEICDRFEAALKAGHRPQVDDYVSLDADPERAALRQELLRVAAHYMPRADTMPQAIYRGVLPARDPPLVAGYEVLGELGRGGMGVVYLARQLRPNRLVALKMISTGGDADARELERFRREADAVAQLQHPHIVQVYEFGEVDGRPYFAFEYVAGGSLDRHLSGTPQPPHAAARLVEQLALAIHHAHQRGIIHRDLKPANVLLAGGDSSPDPTHHSPLTTHHPKITDFGLAKLLDAATANPTQSGDRLGTPSYMAPEQVGGSDAPISAATDVYGLGAILYELLTGRPPFRDSSALQTMLQVQTVEPVSPSRLQPKCPRDLVTICLKCLAKPPRQRYASAAELADDVRRFLDDRPIRARPVGPLSHALKWARRQPVIAGLTALLLLAITVGVGVGCWLWWRAESGWTTASNALESERAAKADREATLDRYRVALAHREWLANNAGQAEALLDACTEEKRQSWEWRYLDRMRRSALHTFSEFGDSGRRNTVQALAIHPSGWQVASASQDMSVRLWDLDRAGGRVIGSHGHPVLAVAYSPDGRLLASASSHTGSIKLWNPASGEMLYEFAFGGTEEVHVRGLAFDPSSRYLAVGGPGLKVWDLYDQKWDYEAAANSVLFHVAFSPDGRYLATASSAEVQVWDWATKATVPEIGWSGHLKGTLDLSFSLGGALLACGGGDGLVRVYNPRTGQEAFTLEAHHLGVTSVCFSPDGNRLATAGVDGDMHVWNVDERRRLFTLHGHSGAVLDLAYTPDGTRLVSCGLDRLIRVWDAAQSQEVVSASVPLPRDIGRLLYSRDNRLVAWVNRFGQAGVWDAVSQQEVYRLPEAGGRPTHRVLAGSPDGRYFAWGCTDGAVRLWDTESRQEVSLPKGGTHFVIGLEFSTDGRRLLVARRGENAVLLGDALTGRDLHALSPPSNESFSAAFSPDARHLTLASEDVIQEWETDSGRLLCTLPPPPEAVANLAYSPAGDALAFGGLRGGVWVWDRFTDRVRVVCAGHARRVQGLTFSADGRRLASSGSDGIAKVWDAQTGHEVLTLRNQLHERSPLAFSPDGADLISVNNDNHLQIWSTRSVHRLP